MVSYTNLGRYDETSREPGRRKGCPGEDLGECLYFLSDLRLFELLRREPTTMKRIRKKLEGGIGGKKRKNMDLQTTAKFLYKAGLENYHNQAIARKLFYFLGPESTDEEPNDEELRRKILRGLADHVRQCTPCNQKYNEEIWGWANEKVGSKIYNSEEEKLLAIGATALVIDRHLLELLLEED